MSPSTALNPVLYGRLRRCFGEVKIRNEGQARIAHVGRDLENNPITRVKQWGEEYVTRCPFCRDQNFSLAVSHMYAQHDDSDRPMLYLAICHNRNCLRSYHNRAALADMLSARDGVLENARILPGKVLSEEERIPVLPASRTRLDKLKKGHPTRCWLKRQGFDPDVLARVYDLSYCEESDEPLTSNRIIIPVSMRGKPQGWQSLSLSPTARRKYLSAPGMHTSEIICNLDRARQYETPIIVQEPLEVWAFGRMAMCPLGKAASDRQLSILRSVLSKKNAVLLIREADREVPAVMDLRMGLTAVLGCNFLVVETPADIPPGRKGRNALRKLITRKAKKRDMEISFTKVEEPHLSDKPRSGLMKRLSDR